MFKNVGAIVQGEDFIGRNEEIDRIISAMKVKNNISIFGMSRIGKSSIVKEMIRRVNSSSIFPKKPFFFEYRLTQDKSIRINFFEKFKNFIMDISNEYCGEETYEIEELKDLIEEIERGLEKDKVHHECYISACEIITRLYDNDIWIILDEMDYANTAFGTNIQSVREIINSDRVRVINISRHSLASIFPIDGNGSNYPGVISVNIPIKGFSDEDMATFKQRFALEIGAEKVEEIWDDLLAYAGNVPFFLSLLANSAMENSGDSLTDIAENPYGKYMETLKYWYQALYSDNMLENAIKFIEDPQQPEAKNLRVFGIVQDGKFSVPYFPAYIKQQNASMQSKGMLEEYLDFQTEIDVLIMRGKSLLQGMMRDKGTLKSVNMYLKELEAMKAKIECMKTLDEKDTFVRITPSIEEINTFDMEIRKINDFFEQLER